MRPETRNPSRRNTTSLVTMLGAVMILCINVLASDEEEASGVFDYRVEMRREIRKKITELSAVPESDVPSHLDNIDDVSIRIPVAAGLILADQSRQNVVRYLAQRPSAQFDDFDLTFGPETQSLMIAEMFELLTSENPKVFEKAIRFLKHIDTIPRDYAAAIHDCCRHEQVWRRKNAFQLIPKLANVTDEDIAVLQEGIADKDSVVCRGAMKAEAELDDFRRSFQSEFRLNDDDPHVRLQAICSVLRLDRQAVYPVQLIQDLYFAEQSQDFRDRVFDVMDCRDGRLLAAKRMLTDALNSDSGTVNVGEFSFETGRNLKAIRILQAAGQSAVPYVRSTLNDNQTSDRVRERLLRNIASCIPAPHPLRNAVERQLYQPREAVRTSSIRLLQHIGDVNAELVWRIFSDSPPSVDSDMLTAVGASLSRSSTETRPAARVALNQLMKHRSFTVRSQSLRSFQTLFPDDIEAIQAALLFEISKASLTDNDNPWSGWRILSEVISNLRPTPPKVIERITEALDRNDDQSTARIPLLLLGAAGESANTSRIELLSHPQPYVRACVAAQLAATGQASVVPHIKKLLDDRATFSRSLSLHMHFEVEVRLAALEALALEQLASKELVPLFRGHLQHDWSRMEAARGLSHVGPTANAAFPDLVNHEPN